MHTDLLSIRGRNYFLYHRKLRKINLAVLRCLDTRITAIGEQLRVGVAHFFDARNLREIIRKMIAMLVEMWYTVSDFDAEYRKTGCGLNQYCCFKEFWKGKRNDSQFSYAYFSL